MKKFPYILSFLVLVAITTWRFYDLVPQTDITNASFSTERTLEHIKKISEKPHFVGTTAHEEVKNYIVNELQQLKLSTEIQEGYTTGDWGNVSYAENIITKIKGSEPGKALVLMAHYDSSPHSSKGASDDAVGVAVILEGIRSFLAEKKTPKNDIIILFTDAEELGLNGAQLFVEKHQLAKEVGLVLNFEARGSGGPSYMLIETNGGNKNMIESFAEANPMFPVANSLAYSIYKMLPNDTDLTIFREKVDVNGFNFAFIDDHFDYHTENDSYENVDANTLQHQISYLVPLLNFYSDYDLNTLTSDTDYVYFDVPVFNFVYYPFQWIFPMLIVAVAIFIVLIFFGFQQKKLSVTAIFKGFGYFLLSLILCGIIGYFGWTVLKYFYPHYRDILQGFTYNGHLYIACFTALCFSICFYIYSKSAKIAVQNLMIAPICIWLIICVGIAFYLQGASFFIIPVYGALGALGIYIFQKKQTRPLLVFIILCIPALWILAPLIQMLPVGLGLKMLIAPCLISVLLFGLLLPVIGLYKNKKSYAYASFVLAVLFFVSAHFQSEYNNERPHPTSLVYLLDNDTKTAQWATYNHELDNWISQYITDENSSEENIKLSSKYSSGFTHVTKAPFKEISSPITEITHDSIANNKRYVTLCINPQRAVNRMEITTKNIEFLACSINGVPLSEEYLKRRGNRLLTHYISNNSYSEINLVFYANEKPVLTIYEASNNLLEHPLFSIPPRPANAIPMPFVLNDAIMTKKTIEL
ncbi:M20/M25/M40 family metallo-hydrolase [Joostella sp. CR20]|uniref:M20/M25/M40 family metallo-hydrolase n=1 Tax=Joostella sp. CR20 TaxID=2804312 RepID=UPI00313D17D5